MPPGTRAGYRERKGTADLLDTGFLSLQQYMRQPVVSLWSCGKGCHFGHKIRGRRRSALANDGGLVVARIFYLVAQRFVLFPVFFLVLPATIPRVFATGTFGELAFVNHATHVALHCLAKVNLGQVPKKGRVGAHVGSLFWREIHVPVNLPIVNVAQGHSEVDILQVGNSTVGRVAVHKEDKATLLLPNVQDGFDYILSSVGGRITRAPCLWIPAPVKARKELKERSTLIGIGRGMRL